MLRLSCLTIWFLENGSDAELRIVPEIENFFIDFTHKIIIDRNETYLPLLISSNTDTFAKKEIDLADFAL